MGAHARECTTRGSPRPAGCAPRQPPRSRSSAPSLTTHTQHRATHTQDHSTKALITQKQKKQCMQRVRVCCVWCKQSQKCVCASPTSKDSRGRYMELYVAAPRIFADLLSLPLSTLYVVSLMEQGLTEPELFRAACASRLARHSTLFLAIHVVVAASGGVSRY